MIIDDDEIKKRNALYEKFCLAAEAAQLLETELSTCALALECLEKKWYIQSAQEGGEFLSKLDRSTLGHLIKRLRRQLEIDEEELAFLEEALEVRNKLNHGFFLRHGFRIQSDEGRAVMIEELEEMHETLFKAWQAASHLGGILTTSVELLKKANSDQLTDPGNS